jgi:hypothetical protein
MSAVYKADENEEPEVAIERSLALADFEKPSEATAEVAREATRGRGNGGAQEAFCIFH